MTAIRGATTVCENTKTEIEKATIELVAQMLEKNDITADNIEAALFSATRDITAAYPAAAMRKIPDMKFIPLFDAQEMEVEGSLRLCIRALFFTDLDKKKDEICHVYLNGAADLRRDLAK